MSSSSSPPDGARAGPPEASAERLRLHASCVRWLERGLLLRGPSGSGKSMLVLRLLQAGAYLVADDAVEVEARGGVLLARATGGPAAVEARGLGIFRLCASDATPLHLLVETAGGAGDGRLPPVRRTAICGVDLATVALDPGRPDAIGALALVLLGQRIA